MNRKECEKALDLIEVSYWSLDKSLSAMKGVSKGIVKLRELICEHFDNPPLKFEEIKEGMWIWDNWVKRWIKVHYTPEEFKNRNLFCTSENDDLMEFDKNRFYRKQVEE